LSAVAAPGAGAYRLRRREGFRIAALALAGAPAVLIAGCWPESTAARDRAATSGVILRVDTRAAGRPISPLIYGVAHASADDLAATGARLHRWGGNPNSRYNWELGSAWNAARDWEFRNYGDGREPAEYAPSGAVDRFVALSRDRGAATYLTVPALGWVARDGSTETRSTGVPAGGGMPLGGPEGAIAGYDPAPSRETTSLRSLARKGAPFAFPPDLTDGVVYQDEWIAHLVDGFGPAAGGGVRYYAVDNEPDLWAETHTDVHPARLGYDDLLAVFLEYATAIKDVDPTAQVAGPCLSGWQALFHSPRDGDAMRSGASRLARRVLPEGLSALGEPDRRAHGGQPVLPWWLEQVRRHDEGAGRRTLDVLDVHFYPQAPGVYPGATDPATNALRLRSTRALWDGTYVDESWIGAPVRLIPRLREWIERSYPGTRLAIGEWNWGADTTLNGALAIADVLGIYGREGVDVAAYWTVPPPGSPGAAAFALYTNHDGRGGAFGERSLPARSSASADVTVYASRDSREGDLVLVAINKRPDVAIPVRMLLEGGPITASGRGYRLGQDTGATMRRIDVPAIRDASLSMALPPYSATVVRVGRGSDG
jgi:hypothetical protein